MSSSAAATAMTMTMVVALAVSPGPSTAQVPGLEQQLEVHLDTLLPLLEEARLEAQRAVAFRDSVLLARSTERLDTLLVGPVRVIVFPDQRSLAQEVVGAAWRDLGVVVARSRGLDAATFFFDGSGRRPPRILGDDVTSLSAPGWVRRSSLEGSTRAALGRALATDLTRPLGAWSGSWSVGPPQRPERVYRELVTTSSRANRACVQGDGHACAAALGLGTPGPLPSDWYGPEEAADLAVRLHTRWSTEAWYRRDLKSLAAGQRCKEDAAAGRYESCRDFLVGQGSRVPAPLGLAVRQTLMWVALQEGGAGAWDRLVADAARSPEEALAAASGLPLPELMAAWRDWIESQRPAVYSGLATTRWVSFFWFLFFSFLALRSSRWRSE